MDDQPSRPLSLEPSDTPYPHREVRQPPLPLPEPPQPAPRRRSRLGGGLSLILLLLIVAGLVAWVVLRSEHQAAPRGGRFQSTGPMPVGTAKVAKGDMPIILNALGTVTPLATVTIKTQINGQLVEVAFQEGQLVNKGDFLAQIDPRPYQVALSQAEGQLAKDQAALKNSEVDLSRYRTLVAQNSIARQQLDTQAALVEQNRGVVKTDQAQVDTQKLNLTYAHIVAPSGGRVGLRQVDQGNYVQTSDANGLVVITQLQPISVIFTLPEDNLRQVMKRLAAGATLTATAYDRTGANKLDVGKLQTVDNQIDPTTGTVKLRAVFDNPGQILFPNQFVNVQLLVDTMHDADLIPNAAIQRGAPGTFVYIVKDDETVAATPVSLGAADNQNTTVTKGVQPGQTIVVDGADRLKDGAKIAIADPGKGPDNQGQDGQNQKAKNPSSDGKKVQGDGAQNPAAQNSAAQTPAAPNPTTQNSAAQNQTAPNAAAAQKPDSASSDSENNPAADHANGHHRRRGSSE